MAKALVKPRRRMGPGKYTDDYRENLMRVIKAKMKGKKVDLVPEEPTAPAPRSST